MKKRIVGTLMALLLAVTVLPQGAISVTSADVTTGLVTTAYAAETHQNHCICGAEHNDGIKTHTSSDVVNYNRAITVSSRSLCYGSTQCALKKWDSSKSQYVNGTELSDAEYYVLPAGNYYIDNDITTIKTILIESGTVNICLNGKKITLKSDYHGNAVFKVLEGATLNLTDCTETSAISAVSSGRGVVVYGTLNLYSGNITKSDRQTGAGAGVYVGASGVFNMYGGKITNNRATSTGGGGVYNLGTFNMYEGAEISGNYANTSTSLDAGGVYNKGGTFTMYGGMITNNGSGKANNGFDVNCGGGVYVYGGSFIMKGGTISGNTAGESGGGVYLQSSQSYTSTLKISGNPIINNNTRNGSSDNVGLGNSNAKIEVTAALTEDAEIVLNSLNGATIAGNSAYYTRTDNGDSVTLTAPTGSSGGETGGETTEHKHCVCGTGTLSAAGHTHDANVTWIGVAALSEITTAGNYYLKNDITLENTWNVPAAGVVLCLNGKTVTAESNGIIVPANSTFTLTDCKPDGKDGCIGGNGWMGVKIRGGGSFILYAGKIEKFHTGLEVLEKGTFTMYGGTIADNNASGVVVQDGGNAVISGGTVTGNSTGVTLGGTLTVDGNAVITGNSYAGINDYGTLTIGGNANITGNGSSWERVNVNMFCVEEKVPAPITVRDDFNGEFGLTTSLQDGTKVINGTVKDTITCDSSRKTIDADGKIQQATSVPVEGVALNKRELSLTEGGTETLTATITPANATNKNVTWSSGDTKIATVDENGLVTGVKAGEVCIFVTTVDGRKADSCAVTVKTAQTGHVHVKGAQKYNESEHWYICTGCSEKLDVGAHVYDNDTDTTCNTCGYVRTISGGGESGGDTPTPTPTPEAPRYYYSSGSGSTGAGGLSAVQNDPNGKSATDYNGGIYGLIFKSYANFSSFQGVQVDGKTIAPANYIAEEGSIEVYLKAVYLRTLAAGKHTVTILSSEGNATAEFTVGGVVSAPKTADAGTLAYLGLALSSYVGTALVTRRKKEF